MANLKQRVEVLENATNGRANDQQKIVVVVADAGKKPDAECIEAIEKESRLPIVVIDAAKREIPAGLTAETERFLRSRGWH